MGRAERRAREFQRREEDILQAAISLFKTDDWRTVTVGQIAEEAGIGKGTVYKHFQSKEEIYAKVAINDLHNYHSQLVQLSPSEEVVEHLRAIIRFDWAYYTDTPEYQRKLTQYCEQEDFLRAIGEGLAAQYLEVQELILSEYRAVLQEGIEQGIFPRQPIEFMVYSGMATAEGIYRMIWDEDFATEDLTTDVFIDYITDFILRGWRCKEEYLTH